MRHAVWIPGWYELDPLLEVGLTREFAFWRDAPDGLPLEESDELVFYNSLSNPHEAIIARGTIASIRHADLGEIRKVNTRGLDYTITLADGTQLLVNAEEEPGTLYEQHRGRWVESSRRISAWRFLVEFDLLSELRLAE